MLKGTIKDVEKLADATSSGLATSVLLLIFHSLDCDSDIEQFLSYIPMFCALAPVLALVPFHQEMFNRFNCDLLPSSIVSIMEHALSSNLLLDSEKLKCITICSRAINADTLFLQSTFQKTLQTPDSDIFRRPDFVGLALEQLRRNDADPWVKDYAQCVVAVALNRTFLDDSARTDIPGRYLKPEHADYRWEGHNLQLCNLIYLTQHLKISRPESSDKFARGNDWHLALVEARKLELRGIARELRHEFVIL